MKCEICGKELKSLRGLTIHLSQGHKLSSQLYFDEYFKQNGDGICLTCGKPTTFQGFRKGYAKFCCVKCVNKNAAIRNKIATTNLDRYGTKTPAQNKEIQEKTKQTNLDRYGTKTPAQNKEIQEKTKQTNLDRYGVDVPAKNPEIKKRMIRNSNRAMYSKLLNSERLKELVIPNFDIDEFIGCDHKHSWTCVKCGNIFDDHLQDGKIPRCYTCYPHKPHPLTSQAEKDIVDFIKSLGIITVSSSKSIIPPLELDIYIPYHNIAIEYNGLYWHSEINGKDKNYHLNKTEMCEKQGIQLLHIFEDEWLNKKDLVKSMIKSKLGLCNRIFARKTTVKQVSYTDSKDFLDNNHIQGSCQASIKLGLYSKDELVALMTFGKPRYNKSYEYELLRYAVKQNHSVVGGFSKLLKYFTKNYQGSLISYADRRYSTGTVYTKNNFKLIHKSKPGFFYTDNFNRYNRMMFQAHKLENKLDIYDSNLSAAQNMHLNGYNRIYDCGNLVYEIN